MGKTPASRSPGPRTPARAVTIRRPLTVATLDQFGRKIGGRDRATASALLIEALLANPVRGRSVMLGRKNMPSYREAGVSLAISRGSLEFKVPADFDPRAVRFLESLDIERIVRTLVFPTFADIGVLLHEAGERIESELGPEALSRAFVKPVPRGGLILASLFAYVNKIPKENFELRSPVFDRNLPNIFQGIRSPRTIILIDDLVLSGTILKQALNAAHELLVTEPQATLLVVSLFRRSDFTLNAEFFRDTILLQGLGKLFAEKRIRFFPCATAELLSTTLHPDIRYPNIVLPWRRPDGSFAERELSIIADSLLIVP